MRRISLIPIAALGSALVLGCGDRPSPSEPATHPPVFRSQHQAELLMWLLLHPEQEYGVTEMAARLGVPRGRCRGAACRSTVHLAAASLTASVNGPRALIPNFRPPS